jgi:hypothetical protein
MFFCEMAMFLLRVPDQPSYTDRFSTRVVHPVSSLSLSLSLSLSRTTWNRFHPGFQGDSDLKSTRETVLLFVQGRPLYTTLASQSSVSVVDRWWVELIQY